MNPKVFRDYDVRGVAARDLDDDFARDLGRALGTSLVRGGARRMAVGRDCRVSSPRLHAAALEGLLSTGIDVVDVGIVPTPVLYFTTFHLDLDGGVMITGSHNPPEDNGFKILRGKTTIFGPDIQALRELMARRDFAEGRGLVETFDVVPAYLEHALGTLRFGARRPKVIVDAGNGV